MKQFDVCLVSAIAGVVALSGAGASAAEETGSQTEMCFGYRLANSCGIQANGCGGSALGYVACGAHPDRYQYPGRWMMVPLGSCKKIYGGSLTPPASNTSDGS